MTFGPIVAPLVWAPLADALGRRPVYVGKTCSDVQHLPPLTQYPACLAVLTVACIGLAEVPTNKWWLLMILRIIQAAGSASTLALSGGVVSDLATPAERGGLMGVTGIGTMV